MYLLMYVPCFFNVIFANFDIYFVRLLSEDVKRMR